MIQQSTQWNAISGGYNRPPAVKLADCLRKQRQCIHVLSGPRQVGKTTLAQQVGPKLGISFHYASADESVLHGTEWIVSQWSAARLEAARTKSDGLLALDEIQKIPDWADTVRRLWDEDSASGLGLRVLLLGSVPPVILQGLDEQLAGRYEVLHLRHWSFPEMRDAFGWGVDQYIFYGGYPGAASLATDSGSWFR